MDQPKSTSCPKFLINSVQNLLALMLPFLIQLLASFFALGQLGYGGNGYCSTCALTNSGSISRGFGFGGGNYDLTGKSLYSLPTSNSLIIPSSYGYSSSSYGSGTGYGSTQTNNNLNYGSSSATGILSNSAYSSAGNGYVNCYNNNCLPSSSLNTVPTASSGIGYGISGSSAIYNPYSSLPDA
ncbi:unnamed protein product, partial [Brugia timori]|uniref:Uncharacterized protein n=1 Tax=Brugia timori TaxID=42155 RepID=A0A0R3Q3P1_9BILA